MSLQRRQLFAGRDIPQLGCAIMTARGQGLIVGSESDGRHVSFVALERCPFLALGRLRRFLNPSLQQVGRAPKPCQVVHSGSGERLAIGGESHTANPVANVFKAGQLFAALGVPQFQRIVHAAGGHQFAVRRYRHRQHLACSTLEDHLLRMRGDVPKANRGVHAACHQGLVVWRKGQAPDAMLVPAQRCLFRPGRHIPELHRVVITPGRKHLTVVAEG